MLDFEFKNELWKYGGPSSWWFVTIPKDVSNEIEVCCGDLKQAWGRIKVQARIGKTSWSTSIFYDSKSACYFLPIKTDVRRCEKLEEGSRVDVAIRLA